MAYKDFDYRHFIVSELNKSHPNPLRSSDLSLAAVRRVPASEKTQNRYVTRISWTLYELKESGIITHDEENHTYSITTVKK